MPLTAAFQFPQLRVRYISLGWYGCAGHSAGSIPAAAGKIHMSEVIIWQAIHKFQFPQLRVRYIPCPGRERVGRRVSIPAVAGKIHLYYGDNLTYSDVSIPAVAGKIHCKNNESTLHICSTICAAFYLCLLYYSGSLKPCLPFAQKAKRSFPVFVFSRVRSPVL